MLFLATNSRFSGLRNLPLFALGIFTFLQTPGYSQTNVLYFEDFNLPKSLVWSGSGEGVGSFSASVVTNLASNGFPTAPASGYLALAANSANKATNAGWWAVGILTNVSTPNGLGQTDLSKISLTARVRAKGLPTNGAAAILRIMASGDDPRSTTLYKRITFEPVLLQGQDWQTIGGTFDDAGLQAASGSRYNFSTTATSYEITVELSGYNQSTTSNYVAYNSPTGPSNGGRKNPGLAPNSSIRFEFDDIRLAVVSPAAQTTAIGAVSPKSGGIGSSITITGVAFGPSPAVSFNGTPASSVTVNGDGTSLTAVVPSGATTGKITVVGSNATATSPYNFFITTPSNLLADPNFDTSQAQEFWNFFEGARLITTNNVAPDATTGWNNIPGAQVSTPFMLFPGWEGTPFAGFMQENIPFNAANGDFFTATFQAKFEGNFSASPINIAFMDGSGAEIATKDITAEVKANQKTSGELGTWKAYQATFKATPAILSAGRLTLKFQPLFRAYQTNLGSVFVDQVSLTQTNSAAVGPQIGLKIGGIPHPSNNLSKTLISPLVGQVTTYQFKVENTGAEDLNVTSVAVSGSSFSVTDGTSPRTISPGSSTTYLVRATPLASGLLTGTLTINNNDKDTTDRTFAIPLTAIAANLADTFDGSETAGNLGWVGSASSSNLLATSSITTSNGNLRLKINASSTATDWDWNFAARKSFVSPGALNLSNSQLSLRLCATGALSLAGRPDLLTNKFELLLESLNQYEETTGSIRFGAWVDEKNYSATKGSTNYFSPDGTNDRVVLTLPDTTNLYTTFNFTNLALSNSTVRTNFDVNAPYFRLTLRANDANFMRDTNNTILVDSLGLSLSQVGFGLVNGGFELDASNIPVPVPPLAWTQNPPDGVNKDILTNGVSVYNQTNTNDLSTIFQAYTGTKAMKIWAQNWKPDGVNWEGPVQTGTVYQEFLASSSLAAGAKIYARGMAKIFSIDPLTGGNTFSFGFKYLNSQDQEVGRDVATLTSSNSGSYLNRWLPLTANGTIPAGADKIRLICEFVQNAESDQGSVYLDDLSVGFGSVTPSVTVGSTPYTLVWSDEFDGTTLNPANWVPEVGRGPNNDGWGNNEAQTYTTNNANLRVENGSLILQAVKSGSSWTSARIKSQGLRSFKYGKIEFRAKLPSGVGPWPAAWMMGTNISTAGWPACGEIDVLEWRAGYNGATNDANTVGHALHSPARNGGNPVEPANRSSVTNPSTEFHTYAVVWTSNNMVFSVDGVDKATLTPPSADAAAFRQEFFLLLNLAMGGSYLGTNNATSISSSLTDATYEVDYVRVYQDPATLSAPADTTPPAITLSGANPVSVNWGAAYSDAGATAFDAGDNANVTVTTNNPVNTGVPGTYLVTYTGTDSKSNTASTNRTVNVSMANSGTNRGADGLTDVLRYAFGGTGTSSISSTLLPSNTVSGGNLVLTYYARTNSNVNLVPVVSTDLANSNSWTNAGVTVTNLSTVSTNGTTLEKRQATTPASGTRKFLRLKATYTP